MNRYIRLPSVVVLSLVIFLPGQPRAVAQDAAAKKMYTVTVDKPENGRIIIASLIPDDGKVPAGTVLMVTASPAAGYALDSGYFTTPGPWGRAYHEFGTPEFRVIVDQDKGFALRSSRRRRWRDSR